MKNRWYSPDNAGLVSITIGLLRDGQYESALEHLEKLYQSSATVPPWLYSIFIFTFGELGFHAESLEIFRHQFKINGPNRALAMWHFLLDVYSRDAYYPGITYIWNRMVTAGLMTPPDGTAVNVLNAAARHGDAAMATSVVRTLSDRGKRLDYHHYEALIDVHMLHGDLNRAFTILCIMHKTGLSPNASSTRSIYETLQQSSSMTSDALAVLRELSQQHHVPTAAFNAVLEAGCSHYDPTGLLDLYRGIGRVCVDGPDLATYNILLSQNLSARLVRFLIDEMEALSIRPDRTTYDHLIRIFSMQDNYELAFHYLDKLRSGDSSGRKGAWWMSRDSALALVRRCIHAKDSRVHGVIEDCRTRGISLDADVRRFLQESPSSDFHSRVDTPQFAAPSSPTEVLIHRSDSRRDKVMLGSVGD
jgi:pentatricopeptide repeat protein